MNRTYRKLMGWLGIVAVMFAQLAVSAYACPLLFQGLGNSTDTVSVSDVSVACADLLSPNLCKKHCENGEQNINDMPEPQACLLALEPAFIVALVLDPHVSSIATALTPSLLHATSPPLSIRNCCFRL